MGNSSAKPTASVITGAPTGALSYQTPGLPCRHARESLPVIHKGCIIRQGLYVPPTWTTRLGGTRERPAHNDRSRSFWVLPLANTDVLAPIPSHG